MLNRLSTLVITGTDPEFEVDLSAFRGVREETGMTFTRLRNPTIKRLQDHLRMLHVDYAGKLPNLHFACHMSAQGIVLQDGTISPTELSEIITGAPNLFLAGCESIEITNTLSSIPYVLAMIEKVSNEDCLTASIIFWSAIGHGYTAPEAFDEVCKRIPSMSEQAYLRSNRFLSPKKRGE